MALTGTGEALHVRPPAVRHFVRLKLKMIRNGMRGRRQRLVLFILGLLGGLWFAFTGFSAFAAGSASDDPDIQITAVGFAGTMLTLGWALLPLLFFGVDETIDPARFALLPVPRRTLATGMLVAACVGVPAAATLICGFGLVVGAATRGGPAAVVVAVLASVLGLVQCVIASRVVTSAFASMLRSRRMRDLAVIVIVLLASSIGPVQMAVVTMLEKGGLGTASAVARVLSWTPLAAPYAAALDAVDGDWALVAARFGIVLACSAVLLWWWSLTLESAMLGTAANGPAGQQKAATGGAVQNLFPAVLHRLPAGRLTAIIARDLRYFWRDPRWRSSLASMTIASLFLPVALVVAPGDNKNAPLPVVAVFVGLLMGLSLANIFGTDGTAYATQLLAAVPGRVELRARAISLATVVLPLLVLVSVVVGVADGAVATVPAGFGMAFAAFGSSLAVAMLAAVFSPYAMPQTGNPFAVSSGGATLRGLLVFVGIALAGGVTGPIIVAYLLLPAALSWLVLPAGLVWGFGAVALGTYIAGDALDRRGPEILVAIAPRS